MNKPIYHFDIQQNTDEWYAIRRGRFTASEFPKLFMKKETKGYNELLDKIAWERIFGETPEESFSNYYTERGKELEPEALEHYKFLTFNDVQRVGLVELNEWVSCSPDGLVNEDGLVQVKCLKFTTHKDYLLTGKVPKDHYIQMQGELFITQRKWNDYFVYHPKLLSKKLTIERDEKLIAELQTELDIAIKEVANRINQITKLAS